MKLLRRFPDKLYAFLFSHRFFYKWNRWVLRCGLKGLGIDNFRSGEKHCLKEMICSLSTPVIVDVGANIGWWSQMAIEVNPSSRIYAFEPHPEAFSVLKTISGIQSFNVACGAQEGTTILYDRQDGLTTHSSLDASVITDLHKQKALRIPVAITTLDQFILFEKIDHIDLLKIDVEGFEYEVLQGAMQSITKGKIHAIVFEFNQMNIVRKRFFRDFLKLLTNYDFFRLLPKGKIPLRYYDPAYCELFGYQNILAILR